MILAHALTDYHSDHRTSSQIIWDIRVMTTVPNIKTEAPPCEKIPEIYHYDCIAGIDFMPQFHVDLSETFELKRQKLACHKSQSVWLQNQYGIGYVEFIEFTGRFRGIQCGARYGECFQLSPTWLKRVDGGLLP